MARVVIIAILAAFVAAFGIVAGVTLRRGQAAGRFATGALLAVIGLGGAAAWGLYWATKQGALSPADFYNSVVGNAVVVGGLLAAAGALLGVLAAFVLLLKAPR